jgi:hypothetical protein
LTFSKRTEILLDHYQESDPIGAGTEGEPCDIVGEWKSTGSEIAVIKATTVVSFRSRQLTLPKGQIVYIAARNANDYLVSWKDGERELVGSIPKSKVRLVENEHWYQIRTTGGREGWVLATSVQSSLKWR